MHLVMNFLKTQFFIIGRELDNAEYFISSSQGQEVLI